MVDKSGKFSLLVRLGFVARGVVYLLLGYLALSTAGRAREGQAAVFDLVQDVPGGALLLYLIALGLLAYAIFRAIDAVSDLENSGDDAKGRLKRIGAAASAIAHAFLAFTAWQFANGEKQQAAGAAAATRGKAGAVLDWELGPMLLGIVGVGFVAGALTQFKSAYSADFMRHIGGGAPRYVEPIGRGGYAARGVVFLLIGWSLIKGAWFSTAAEVRGLGEAVVALSGSGLLYTLVALGLVLFGAFSLLTAPYRIIPDIRRGDLKPRL